MREKEKRTSLENGAVHPRMAQYAHNAHHCMSRESPQKISFQPFRVLSIPRLNQILISCHHQLPPPPSTSSSSSSTTGPPAAGSSLPESQSSQFPRSRRFPLLLPAPVGTTYLPSVRSTSFPLRSRSAAANDLPHFCHSATGALLVRSSTLAAATRDATSCAPGLAKSTSSQFHWVRPG